MSTLVNAPKLRAKCTKKTSCALLTQAMEDGDKQPRRGLDSSLIINFSTCASRVCVINRCRGGAALLVNFCPFCGVRLEPARKAPR